jgi:release factor glutamine methyltransferase
MSLEEIFFIKKLKALLEESIATLPDQLSRWNHFLDRLNRGEPIQYIMGYTEFYGRRFLVNPSVLIPRPETEELVHWILEDLNALIRKPIEESFKILDLGTGSGIIPISLQLENPALDLWGLDISRPALDLARENNQNLGAGVRWLEGDILGLGNPDIIPKEFKPLDGPIQDITYPSFPQSWDIIVSNPPYIPISEKNILDRRVKSFEPSLALFVEDHDPLLFYRSILEFANHHLKKNGWVYFEINEKYPMEIKNLGSGLGFKSIELSRDQRGKDRMVRLKKP